MKKILFALIMCLSIASYAQIIKAPAKPLSDNQISEIVRKQRIENEIAGRPSPDHIQPDSLLVLTMGDGTPFVVVVQKADTERKILGAIHNLAAKHGGVVSIGNGDASKSKTDTTTDSETTATIPSETFWDNNWGWLLLGLALLLAWFVISTYKRNEKETVTDETLRQNMPVIPGGVTDRNVLTSMDQAVRNLGLSVDWSKDPAVKGKFNSLLKTPIDYANGVQLGMAKNVTAYSRPGRINNGPIEDITYFSACGNLVMPGYYINGSRLQRGVHYTFTPDPVQSEELQQENRNASTSSTTENRAAETSSTSEVTVPTADASLGNTVLNLNSLVTALSDMFKDKDNGKLTITVPNGVTIEAEFSSTSLFSSNGVASHNQEKSATAIH